MGGVATVDGNVRHTRVGCAARVDRLAMYMLALGLCGHLRAWFGQCAVINVHVHAMCEM